MGALAEGHRPGVRGERGGGEGAWGRGDRREQER